MLFFHAGPAQFHDLFPERLERPEIKLLRAYLTVGAKICGPPALDRQFKTIDFLTLMDLETMSAKTRERYFS